MASPNMCLIRLKQAHLEPRTEYVVRREFIPVDKTSVRVKTTTRDGYLVNQTAGVAINPARRMSEADRRELGIRRNGQPRRARRALTTTPDNRKTAA